MIEQFPFENPFDFAILNGKVSAAINRKLSRIFARMVEITPRTVDSPFFLTINHGFTANQFAILKTKIEPIDKFGTPAFFHNKKRTNLISFKPKPVKGKTFHRKQDIEKALQG